MKALVHYTPELKASAEVFEFMVPSLRRWGWDVEAVEGLTPASIDGELPPVMENSFLSKDEGIRQRTKLACSLNHYNFWQRVVEENTPMAFVEHDVVAIGTPKPPEYEVEYLSAEFIVPRLDSQVRYMHTFRNRPYGASPLSYNNYHLKYLSDNPYHEGLHLPNTSAYSCTPEGARKLIAAFEDNGAEHSDMQINTNVVTIGVRTPSLFKHLVNPHTSSGRYWKL